jgi:hypothetical protein
VLVPHHLGYATLAKDDDFPKKKIFLAMNERSNFMADWKSV